MEAKEDTKPETGKLGVYRAIAKVQGELAKEGIGKDRKNDQQGYKFRGIDDIYNALSKLLADSGLCVLPRVLSREVTERTNKNGTALFYVLVDVEYDFICAADGSRHVVKVYGEAMDSGDKATNKAMSAAYKYACLQTFCIPTEGDNDADATTHEVAANQSPPKQQDRLAAYNAAKQEYAVEITYLPDGFPDYITFITRLQVALEGAKTLNDVSMLKKANAKTLNQMKAEQPALFEDVKQHFTDYSNALA